MEEKKGLKSRIFQIMFEGFWNQEFPKLCLKDFEIKNFQNCVWILILQNFCQFYFLS